MSYITIFFIAIGLSFDTFAVSISTGLIVNQIRFLQAVRVALIMALFQTVMPLIGIFAGLQIADYIKNYDHWIAFALLSLLGAKMIYESFKANDETTTPNPLKLSNVISMSIATSIDALAVGVSFAFLQIEITAMAVIIGAVTFLVAMLGMLFGSKVGHHFGSKLDLIGAAILIGIGIKILLDHIL